MPASRGKIVMVQTSKNTAERATDAKDTSDNLTQTGSRMIERGEDLTGGLVDAIKDLMVLPSQAALKLFKAECELACAWVELAGQQAAHQAETLQRLAASRDWREAVDRCLDLQGELVMANLLVAGEESARQAA
jgi:hypothetical protein